MAAGAGGGDLTHEAKLVREGWSLVEGDPIRFARLVYSRLFIDAPDVQGLFRGYRADQKQLGHLVEAVRMMVDAADNPELIRGRLRQLGVDHRKFDTRPIFYEALGEALTSTLREMGGDRWNTNIDAAWNACYDRVAAVMRGAAAERAGTPAYWTAEVIAHERWSEDLAVFTVQPSQPYAFRAGQYCTIKLGQLGRDEWRPMSIANAPAGNNQLTFYVRAVLGGLVSPALVAHLKVGDTLRLGPPLGGPLVADRAYTHGLVVVCGGAGCAAAKAVVEHIATWESPRPQVRAYIGLRRMDDVPILPGLVALASRVPELQVTGVMSDDRGWTGPRGPVGDFASAVEGPLLVRSRDDVFVAGPPGMIESTVDRFMAAGVPRERIHTDFDDWGLRNTV